MILRIAPCVTVVTRKLPHGTERHSSREPSTTVPVNVEKRNTAHIVNVHSSAQHSDRSLARNVNSRYGHAVGFSSVGLSFDRPSHNYATGISQTHFEDSCLVYRAPQQSSVTPSCYQPMTAITGRPASSNSRHRSSVGFGTSFRTTSTHLPRSHTSAANLSSSSLGTSSYHYQRPSYDPKSSSRRSLPYTAYRT